MEILRKGPKSLLVFEFLSKMPGRHLLALFAAVIII
jgi:N-glycosylase/DNA lyase